MAQKHDKHSDQITAVLIKPKESEKINLQQLIARLSLLIANLIGRHDAKRARKVPVAGMKHGRG